jgi:hypothetical protein
MKCDVGVPAIADRDPPASDRPRLFPHFFAPKFASGSSSARSLRASEFRATTQGPPFLGRDHPRSVSQETQNGAYEKVADP